MQTVHPDAERATSLLTTYPPVTSSRRMGCARDSNQASFDSISKGLRHGAISAAPPPEPVSRRVHVTQDDPGALGLAGGDCSAFKTAAFKGGRSSVIVCQMI